MTKKEIAEAAKKAAKKKADDAKKKKKAKTSSSSSSSSSSPANDKQPMKKNKKLTKLERLEEARKAFKWWEAPELPNGVNWQKLEHCGVNFAPPYVRHDIPMKYDGKSVQLTDEQEEMASFYAAMPSDGPQLGNAKTRKVFQQNFFKDFKGNSSQNTKIFMLSNTLYFQ